MSIKLSEIYQFSRLSGAREPNWLIDWSIMECFQGNRDWQNIPRALPPVSGKVYCHNSVAIQGIFFVKVALTIKMLGTTASEESTAVFMMCMTAAEIIVTASLQRGVNIRDLVSIHKSLG